VLDTNFLIQQLPSFRSIVSQVDEGIRFVIPIAVIHDLALMYVQAYATCPNILDKLLENKPLMQRRLWNFYSNVFLAVVDELSFKQSMNIYQSARYGSDSYFASRICDRLH